MKRVLWFCLFWLGVLPVLGEDFRAILQEAFERRASLTYTQRMKVWTGDVEPVKNITWNIVAQRKNSDGSVWRVEERTFGKEGKLQRWNIGYSTLVQRKLYRDGFLHLLRLSKFIRVCVQYPSRVKADAIPNGANVAGEAVTEGIRPCWRVRVSKKNGEMMEYLVDQQLHFIIRERSYTSQGQISTTTAMELPQMDLELPDDLFAVPERLEIQPAKDAREATKLLAACQKKHYGMVTDLRAKIQRDAGNNKRKIKDLTAAQTWDLD
ncbi:MAG: hypothetical protein IJJ26_04185 [Victivallales bacterium]|nr:hypothetical protein [Victivallales bacterium]